MHYIRFITLKAASESHFPTIFKFCEELRVPKAESNTTPMFTALCNI